MRLEILAGPGAPAFVLAASGTRAALLIPRERRVVRDAPPEEILGALTGVTLGPADLLAILTGCVLPDPTSTGGRLHRNGWASIELSGGATVYLEKAGPGWRVRGATRGPWRIEYPEWAAGAPYPARVRLSASTPIAIDLKVAVSQIDTGKDLSDGVFDLPDGGERPLTLDELREMGPLGGQ
jgi:hypothetical protein